MVINNRSPSAPERKRYEIIFVENACEYYTTARFAMHAQCMHVCGILFHHAVEMLLKRRACKTAGPL
jgi:hypothetical protein